MSIMQRQDSSSDESTQSEQWHDDGEYRHKRIQNCWQLSIGTEKKQIEAKSLSIDVAVLPCQSKQGVDIGKFCVNFPDEIREENDENYNHSKQQVAPADRSRSEHDRYQQRNSKQNGGRVHLVEYPK